MGPNAIKAVKANLNRLLERRLVTPQAVQVYFFLKILHTGLPDGMCSSMTATELEEMVEHVERQLGKLNGNSEEAPASGG